MDSSLKNILESRSSFPYNFRHAPSPTLPPQPRSLNFQTGGDDAGAEFVRWANELAEAEEIQRAIALASKQGAK